MGILKRIAKAWQKTKPEKPKHVMVRVFWSVVRIVVLSYIGLAAVLTGCQSHFVYFPLEDLDGSPDDFKLAYEDVYLETEDGLKLHSWFVPAKNASATVLICHGNAGNISHRLSLLKTFNRMGLNSLIFDYRGYGQSEGKPSEEGTYLDAKAAWTYLTEQRSIAPEQIVLFGRSLGGAVAAHQAAETSPGALIVDSTFTSLPDIAADTYPFILGARLLCRYDYATADYVRKIECPLLVMHSPDDKTISFSHGRAVFEAASEPKQFMQINGLHNEDSLIAGNAYADELKRFLSKHLPD